LKVSTIAIDGPAASGKSTVGELLARRLGYLYFDTGVMYRAVTWAALDRGIPIEDETAVAALAGELRIDVTPPTADDGRQYTVLADGTDITWEIRTPEVNAAVSPVSAYAGVRREMVRQQRRVAAGGARRATTRLCWPLCAAVTRLTAAGIYRLYGWPRTRSFWTRRT
jgi:cytidylate kinase